MNKKEKQLAIWMCVCVCALVYGSMYHSYHSLCAYMYIFAMMASMCVIYFSVHQYSGGTTVRMRQILYLYDDYIFSRHTNTFTHSHTLPLRISLLAGDLSASQADSFVSIWTVCIANFRLKRWQQQEQEQKGNNSNINFDSINIHGGDEYFDGKIE